MISENENTRISKFLSLVLRHQPDMVGINLDANGWTDVNILLERAGRKGFRISPEVLNYVVETNSKKRFAYNGDKTMIRASQGHSVKVELGYESAMPPDILYHGTAIQNIDSIVKRGLEKMGRHHVHLSSDRETAHMVGMRHGKPVIFEVLAGKMFNGGLEFYLTENKVWLTDYVPAGFLRQESKVQ
jgi:putative RNA 2'-phosphotransferase